MGKRRCRTNEIAEFATIVCVKCGTTRVLENPCPSCGASPRTNEVNHSVVQRRERLAIIDAADAPTSSIELSLVPDDWGSVLQDAANKLTTGFGLLLAGAPQDELEEFGTFLHMLKEYAERLAELSTKRPTGLALAIHTAASALLAAWGHVRVSATTSDIELAQREVALAQDLLDNGTNDLGKINEVKEVTSLLNDESQGTLPKRLLAALQEWYGLRNLDGLLGSDQRLAQEVLGRSIPAPHSLGLSILSVVAQAHLDWNETKKKVRAADDACNHPARLREISRMDGALDGLTATDRLLREALDAFARAVQDVSDVQTVTRRLLRMAAELFEESQAVLTWYRLLQSDTSGNDRYRKWSQKDSTDHSNHLAEAPATATVFSAYKTYLRNAPSHGGSYWVDPSSGDVTFNLRSHRAILKAADVVDEVLALLESLLAAQWALENRLLEAGISVTPNEGDLRFLGLDDTEVLAALIELDHGTPVSLHQSADGDHVFAFECDLEEALATANTLATMLPDSATSITVGQVKDGIVDVPLAALTSALSVQEDAELAERLLRLGEFLAQSERDGSPLLSTAQADGLIRTLALLDKGPLSERLPRLRRFLNAARLAGLGNAAEKAKAAMGLLRADRTIELEQKATGWERGTELALPREGAARVNLR